MHTPHTSTVQTTATHAPSQADVAAWLDQHFGPNHCVEHQVLVLAEEVGELCRAVVKRAQGIRGTHTEWTTQLRAEAADVLITLLAIAGTERFDLHQAAATKWAVVTGRDTTAHRMPNEADAA
jgi:NTP pyrophosphatase (non-canonical NTP hydrolase)